MIVAKSISKSINKTEIIKDVSACFDSGVYCILGKNGAGKSILLRMLAGALKPDSGTIEIDAQDLYANGASPRQQIGYFPETPQIFDFLSVEEFLNFIAGVKNISKREYLEILDQISMVENLERKISVLSNGMQRKVLLAACLMGEPNHLILDEPTNALDSQALNYLFRKFDQYMSKKEKVIIFATHRKDVAQMFGSECYILKDGHLKLSKE